MPVSKATKEKWRIVMNVILAEILAPMLFGISTSLYLPSFHRFVTNPAQTTQNETLFNKENAEPGLGLSEMFYSLLMTSFFGGEIVGGLLSGFLVNCVPYWYQFVFAISLHTIGYVLYGVATNGWILLVGMFLAGCYLGAQITLSMTYATELSSTYVNLLKEEKNNKDFDYQTKVVRTRNFFYAIHSIGFSIGYTVGPCIAVLFAHLPIEQYRPVAWFNVAYGVTLLVLFSFLFRGESSWKRAQSRQCSKNSPQEEAKLKPLQIFIIISMNLLSFVQMLRWGYFEALMNPVLSDSFGFTLKTSSYVYIGITFSSVVGSLLLFLLQKLKISTQKIAFLSISGTVIGYLLATDWQTIPYDPCTEYSPFHHPGKFLSHNHTSAIKQTFLSQIQSPVNLPQESTFTLYMDVKTKLIFGNNLTLKFEYPGLQSGYECEVVSSCKFCEGSTPCVSLVLIDNIQDKMVESFLCSHYSLHNICITSYQNSKQTPFEPEADIQVLMVLPENVYSVASNACINANVSAGECQWIPFASGERCEDCSPICRGKQRTLLLLLYLMGMILVVGTYQIAWVCIIAIASNQSPESLQGVVVGCINAANGLAESLSPIIVIGLYEGAEKREFPPSILFACLNIPFLIEIIILYKYLGPSHEQKYSQLKGEEH